MVGVPEDDDDDTDDNNSSVSFDFIFSRSCLTRSTMVLIRTIISSRADDDCDAIV
jgi:hypothetical protein